MADIEETQRRIVAALGRIDVGLDALNTPSTPQIDPEAHAAVQAALDAEQRKSAQLEAQISDLQTQHAAELAQAQAAPPAGPDVGPLDAELQSLKHQVKALRDTNQALREAQDSEGADPDLITQSLRVELDALRAERAAEIAESTAILAALEPMLASQKEGA